MKPRFALSLSFDGLALLHRAAGGWRSMGEVGIDSPDLAGELSALRQRAGALTGDAIRTKLIIPNDQIRYMTLATGKLEGEARMDRVREALIGATPYTVEELAFDVSVDGPVTHVAAVARETLDEAEAFAVEHGFEPVSFVAVPGDNPFLGEPWFGATRHAETLLDPADTVEADGIAVVVIGPFEATPSVPVPAEPEPQPVAEPEPEPEPEPAPEPEPEAPTPNSAPADPTPAAQPEPDAAAPKVEAQPVIGFSSRRASGAAPALSGATRAAPESAAPVDSVLPATPPADTPARPAPEVAPPEPAAAAAPIRMPEEKPAATPRPVVGVTAPRIDLGDAPVPTPPPPRGIAATLAPKPRKQVARSGAIGAFLSRRKPDAVAAPPAAPPCPEPVPAAPTPAAAAVATAPLDDEATRLTVFGARQTSQAQRGKPRYLGLILTAVLLLFLAGVAAWAAVFVNDGLARFFGPARSDMDVVRPMEPDAPEPPAETELASLPPPASVQPEPSRTPDLTDTDAAVLDALRAPAEPTPEPDQQPPLPSLADVEARYAVTGIWLRAPREPVSPPLVTLDDLYLTSIDPVTSGQDAVALPQPTSYLTDLPLGSVASPTAAGIQFDRDPQGRIVPTPEGALDPDGFTVILGRPPVVPPPTPPRQEAEPEEAAAVAVALPGLRPRPRPGNFTETNERSQLGGLTLSELSGIRPRLRPEVEKAAEEADEAPTSQAVRASLAPNPRPSDFGRIVSEARPQTQPQDNAGDSSDAPVQVAAAAPAPQSAPRIPSSASVARQATVNNAINLRNVNLIGVYGTPSNRRALVRLPNGRYMKVKVGDTVDGGRVSAIGDSELRYQKGGRNVILRIPSS